MDENEKMHRGMGFKKPGHLTKDVPNRIGVEYKTGDAILVHKSGMCFHLKTGLMVSFKRDEYEL